MMNLSRTTKQIIFIMIALSFIFLGIYSFFSESIKAILLGITLGTGFSILKLILIEKTLNRSLNMPQQKAVAYTRLHYTLRYILTGAVLLIASLRKENIDLLSVIVGLILLKPAVYIVSFFSNKESRNNL